MYAVLYILEVEQLPQRFLTCVTFPCVDLCWASLPWWGRFSVVARSQFHLKIFEQLGRDCLQSLTSPPQSDCYRMSFLIFWKHFSFFLSHHKLYCQKSAETVVIWLAGAEKSDGHFILEYCKMNFTSCISFKMLSSAQSQKVTNQLTVDKYSNAHLSWSPSFY